MPLLPRTAPQTPLDAIRAHLEAFSEGDLEFQNRLLQMIQEMKKQCVPVLGQWMVNESTSKALRRKLIGLVSRFDWPEWVPYLNIALDQEKDLGTFDEGASALGLIGNRHAFLALKKLQETRPSQDHQTILARELVAFTASQPFVHFLGRLQEGAGNPRLAFQGAKILSVMVGKEHLSALSELLKEGDDVVKKLTLRIIAGVEDSSATEILKELITQTEASISDNLALLETLRKTSGISNNRSQAKEEMTKTVLAHFGARCPEGAEKLAGAATKPAEAINAKSLVSPFQRVASGFNESFILESLELLLENKIARFTAFHSETLEVAEVRQEKLISLLEQAGESLAQRVDRGQAMLEDVSPVLESVFQSHTGSDAFNAVFLRLVSPENASALDLMLSDSDLTRRQKYINGIGSREDDAFTPFLMKALQDSIVEVGQLAMHHLAKLPSAFSLLMDQFRSGQPEQVRKAIRVFGENQTAAAAASLTEFLKRDASDTLLVEAVEALAQIRYPEAVPTLLELLHDGKPLNLQVALTQALGLLARPDASLGLLRKAALLKHPQVLMLCLEGSLAAFPSFETPLSPDELPDLMALVDRCWDVREGEGQRLSTVLVMMNLFTFDQAIYDKLKDRFSLFLTEMRTKETWDRSNNERVAAIIKELGNRSASLGLLAKKEQSLQLAMQGTEPKGPKRTESLLALRELLKDEGLILRPEMAIVIGAFAFREMHREGNDWRDLAHLCEIGGLTHQKDLIEAINEIYIRASGLGLKSAAKLALLQLGLPESELNRRLPIRTILVVEPSSFFRKKVTAALGAVGRWKLFEAGNRQEAQNILDMGLVDLLFTEIQDADGEMGAWIDSQWMQSRCRRVILSSSRRDLGQLPAANWYEGALFKPYTMEKLLQVLGVGSSIQTP